MPFLHFNKPLKENRANQLNISRKVDVVFVIGHMGPGGAQRVVSLVANEWVRQGKNVQIFTATDEYSDVHHLEPHIRKEVILRSRKKTRDKDEVTAARNSMYFKNPLHRALRLARELASLINYIRITFQLRRLLHRAKPRVVLAMITPTNIVTAFAAMGLGLRVILSERNDPARQSFGFFWDVLRRLVYPRIQMVTANTQEALRLLRAFVPPERLAFLPNPLIVRRSSPDHRPCQSRILTVGQLKFQKGYDVLLKGFARTRVKYTHWRLAIAGDGSEREDLERLARNLGIDGAIEWLGYVNNPTDLYRSSDIFVLASRYEGTPNALIEAMNEGLPPVITNVQNGALEYVKHEVSGLVVPVNDVEQLAAAMGRLMSDVMLRRRIGFAAWERVQSCALEKTMPVWDQVVWPVVLPET